MSRELVHTDGGSSGNEGYSTTISLTIPIGLIGKVEDFAKRYKVNRSTAIRQLLETALLVERKVGMVESWTSEDLDDIRRELESGQLVDWIETLPRERFSAIMNILKDEERARNEAKKKK